MSDRYLALWESWRVRRDGAAFEALVRPDLGRALGLARSVGCTAEDAEDAVQEALARLASERSDAPRRVGVRAWFFRTVRDRARVQVRSGRRRRSRERAAARPEGVEENGPGLAVREQVERALLGLGEEEREAIRLRFLQDLDYAEMAYVLDVSENACRLRVHRALGTLKARLGAGAAALIAALPLPSPVDAAILVKSALASAAGSGTVTAASTGGAIAMASASKVAAGVAVGLALGLAGGFAAGILGGHGGTGRAAPVPVSLAREPEAAPRPPAESAPALASSPVAAPAIRGPFPAGGETTPEERAFLAEALADHRRRRALSRLEEADGGLDILGRAREADPDLSSLLWDFERIASHVRTGEGTLRQVFPSGDPTEVNLDDLAGESAVVVFGPGRFTFGKAARKFHDLRAGLKSLEIRGAGMDQTVVEGGPYSFLMVVGTLENLRVKDLTFDGGPGREGTLDIRGDVSAAFENVRFQNLQNAGHSAPIGVSGHAFLGMKNCEFLGSGKEFGLSVRGQTLCLLDGCLFADLKATIIGDRDREDSAVHLLGCTYENSPVADSRVGGRDGKGGKFPIRVRGGRALLGPPDMEEEQRREAWGAAYLAECEGVAFGPARPGCTVADLLSVLDRATARADEFLFRVAVVGTDRSGPTSFVVSFRSPSGGSSRNVLLRKTPMGLEESDYKGSRPWIPPEEETRGALPVAQVVRLSGLSPETAAMVIGFSRPFPVGEERVPSVLIESGTSWTRWVLHGLTGDVLSPRKAGEPSPEKGATGAPGLPGNTGTSGGGGGR